MTRSINRLSPVFLVLALLFTSAPTVAQSYNFTIDIVKSEKAPDKRLISKSQWRSFLKKSSAVVLDSMQGAAELGKFSYILEGYKMPIPYKDPRAGAYQVQYVDLGMKTDIKVTQQDDGMLFVEARGERSVGSPIKEHPKRASAIIFESGVTLKRGQTVVISAMRGVMNLKYLKPHFPDLTVDESDYLLMVLTIE
jgi:hypothetical protein